MDPNENLDTLRVILAASSDTMDPLEARASLDVVREQFEILDEWLSKGGALPLSWERAK